MRIAYGINGEGRGHAGRSLTLINALTELGHEVFTFAGDEAYEFLTSADLFNIDRIPALRFGMVEGDISLLRTVPNAVRFIRGALVAIDQMAQTMRASRVQIAITDFEPLMARAALRVGIPLVSIDNQHKFTSWPKGLPLKLKFYSVMAGLFTRAMVPQPDHVIVTTFHDTAPETSDYKFVQAPVLVRKDFTRIEPTDGEHVVVYIKPSLAKQIVPVLNEVPEHRFHVYGSNLLGLAGNIFFKSTSPTMFVSDLASCKAVICCAGNQLIGESRYFGKRVLTMPLKGQGEQAVNAWHVRNEGFGDACETDELTPQRVRAFLNNVRPVQRTPNGLSRVLAELCPLLTD